MTTRKVMDSSSDEEENWRALNKSVKEKHKYLINNKVLSDVTFIFDYGETTQKEIYAHSLVLSAASSIFSISLRENYENKTIIITDVSDDVFLEFLRFLYIDYSNFTGKNVIPILGLAKKYQVPVLEEKCCEFVEKDLTNDIICEVLQCCIENNYEKLKNICIESIAQNISFIINLKAFLEINKTTLETILNIDKMLCSEFDLFLAVKEWANTECVRRQLSLNGANFRAVLCDLIKLIRFPTMTFNEFFQCIQIEGLLEPDEILSIVYGFSMERKNKFGFINTKRLDIDKIAYSNIEIPRSDGVCWNVSGSQVTEFILNKFAYIDGVDIMYFNTSTTYSNSPNVTVKLLNDKNEILFTKSIGSLINIRFDKPILLAANHTYFIDFDFSYYVTINRFVLQAPRTIKTNEFVVTFSKLSEILTKMYFKPCN